MPPVVAAAAITGATGIAGGVISSRASSGANRRATQAQQDAARRAEAFERDQDALNRADQARRDAEDQRRWDTEQANIRRKEEQEDALLRDNIARATYEDTIRYGKMVNLARLTGQPLPPPIPKRTAFDPASAFTVNRLSREPVTGPLMSRPSTANAMIAQPGQMEPFMTPQRMPMSNLVGRRRTI